MSAADTFFDTNVVLYLLSANDAKADLAEDLISRGGQVSVQVLNEVANVARRKLALSWAEVSDITNAATGSLRDRAAHSGNASAWMQVAKRYGFSVYDSMIVASALIAGCTTLYTEDMQEGQVLEDHLTIRNPFAG
jgi:predicted nucleic acid-binding protein